MIDRINKKMARHHFCKIMKIIVELNDRLLPICCDFGCCHRNDYLNVPGFLVGSTVFRWCLVWLGLKLCVSVGLSGQWKISKSVWKCRRSGPRLRKSRRALENSIGGGELRNSSNTAPLSRIQRVQCTSLNAGGCVLVRHAQSALHRLRMYTLTTNYWSTEKTSRPEWAGVEGLSLKRAPNSYFHRHRACLAAQTEFHTCTRRPGPSCPATRLAFHQNCPSNVRHVNQWTNKI